MMARVVPRGVVGKDLRLRMRGWRWAGVTTLYITMLGLVALGFLLRKYSPSPGTSTRTGIHLFQSLAIFQLFLIVFVTPASMAGAISGERLNRTWDLLLLSRLSAGAIVWGKLLVGLASNLLLVVASLPLYCLVFLFGGVSFGDVARTVFVLAITILLFGVASLLVSALTARIIVSFLVSIALSLALTVGLATLTLYLEAGNQFGVLSLGGIPFQFDSPSSTLTPFAQLDPLIALLSALPDGSSRSVLGGLGIVHHAFGVPWQVPLWGAYCLIAVVLSAVLLLVVTRLVARASGSGALGLPIVARRGRG